VCDLPTLGRGEYACCVLCTLSGFKHPCRLCVRVCACPIASRPLTVRILLVRMCVPCTTPPPPPLNTHKHTYTHTHTRTCAPTTHTHTHTPHIHTRAHAPLSYVLGIACSYARPGPPVPPGPPAPLSFAGELRCAMRQLAVETAADKLHASFGPRASKLVSDAVRLHECLNSTALMHHASERSRTPVGPAVREPDAAERASKHHHTHAQPRHTRITDIAPDDAATAAATSVFEVTISPTGSDTTGDGSRSNPFLSPGRARDAIRAARRTISSTKEPHSGVRHTSMGTNIPAIVHVEGGRSPRPLFLEV
jgi:hypothetical protein